MSRGARRCRGWLGFGMEPEPQPQPQPEPEPELQPEPQLWPAACCVVSGASRGFGRSLVLLLAPRLGRGSLLLLLARSAAQLAELAAELRDAGSGLRVEFVAADLGCEQGLRQATAALREMLPAGPSGRLLLINNAGNDPPSSSPPQGRCSPRLRATAPASLHWLCAGWARPQSSLDPD